MDNKIEILDVTLRDGEQTRGVVFTAEEKLNIASFLLERVKVPRVEVTSARVSEGNYVQFKISFTGPKKTVFRIRLNYSDL